MSGEPSEQELHTELNDERDIELGETSRIHQGKLQHGNELRSELASSQLCHSCQWKLTCLESKQTHRIQFVSDIWTVLIEFCVIFFIKGEHWTNSKCGEKGSQEESGEIPLRYPSLI